MATKDEDERPRRPAATTPQARERQLIALSYDEAERQIVEGRASSQIIAHFLKAGSTREFIEQERLRNEVELLEAKREVMAAGARIEELYEGAINAMRSYQGETPPSEDDDYED